MRFMAILKIARLGNPVLLRVADPVADPLAPEMQRLLDDMVETMEDANGLGLAAPQVHRSVRLFIWRVGDGVAAIFNPEITPLDGPMAASFEGCLSIPGLRGEVSRPSRIAFQGLDAAGQPISGTAEGLAARVMQHECDHLNGVLYPMRMTDLSRLGFTEELARSQE